MQNTPSYDRSSLSKYGLLVILLLGVVFCSKIPLIADLLYWHTSVFVKTGYNYAHIRDYNTGMDIDEVKSLLPDKSTLVIKRDSTDESFSLGSTRYQLYPIIVTWYAATNAYTSNTYLIDNTHSIYQNARFVTLKTGQRIIDINNSGFLNRHTPKPPSIYLTALSFIITSALYILIGLAILGLLKYNMLDWFQLGGASYLVGFLLSNFILGLLVITGLPLNQAMVLITCSGIAIVLWSMLRFRFKKAFTPLQLPLNEYSLSNKINGLLVSAIIFVVALVLCINFIRVVDFGDAISFWMIKAKMIFYEQSFVFVNTHHIDYPILLPLSVATNYAILGSASDELAMWGVNMIFLCVLSQIYEGVWVFTKQRAVALLAIFLYVILYFYNYITLTPTGDQLILAFLSACTINAILYLTKGENKYLILCFLFATGLTLTKNEGLVYAGFIGGLIFFFTFSFSNIKNPKPWLILISFSLLATLTIGWRWYLNHGGYYHGQSDFGNEPVTLVKVYKLLKTQIFLLVDGNFQLGIMLGIIITFAGISRKIRLIEVQFLLFMILLSLFFALFSILLWPTDTIIKHAASATPRLALQSSPLLLLLLGILASEYIIASFKPGSPAEL